MAIISQFVLTPYADNTDIMPDGEEVPAEDEASPIAELKWIVHNSALHVLFRDASIHNDIIISSYT